jgi:hypothetical protein
MRFGLIVYTISLLRATTVDICQAVCLEVGACANDDSYHGSYCKSWQTIPVCFGMYTRADGTYCFQPNDPSCDDRILQPLLCSAATLTGVPAATSTTVAPLVTLPFTTTTTTTTNPTTTAAAATAAAATPIVTIPFTSTTTTTVTPVAALTFPVTATTETPATITFTPAI